MEYFWLYATLANDNYEFYIETWKHISEVIPDFGGDDA
jgi:hypothetical protein